MSDVGLQLKAALLGNFDTEVERAGKGMLSAAQGAVFGYAETERAILQEDFRRSGLARAAELSHTWSIKTFTNGGKDPAALVYSKMPIVQAAFEQGATIRSAHGFFLLIPNPDVWGRDRVTHRRKGGDAQSTLAVGQNRFGKLSFVYRRGKVSFLVANVRESAAQPGTFKALSTRASNGFAFGGRGKGVATIIVFFLVPQARLKHRLHGDVIRAQAQREAPREIERRFVQLFAADDPGTTATGGQT